MISPAVSSSFRERLTVMGLRDRTAAMAVTGNPVNALEISRSISDRVDYPSIRLSCFGIISVSVLPGVVPPLNLTAAYRSLWYAHFGQGSSISLPKVMALHRRGSISHTGWSFDWNNPSMNYLYHRTFLCPVPYVHKVGIKGKNQNFPRLRKV